MKGVLISASIASILLLAIFSLSCAQQSPSSLPTLAPAPTPSPSPPASPPAPSPQPPPAPVLSAGKWVADGVISAGEYTGSRNYGNYELYWTSDATYIYIGMKAKTSGWIALGLQLGFRMKDADMIMGNIKGGKVGVDDLFSTGDFGPHLPDIQQGGVYNIIEFGGKEEGGYIVIEFKRALDTGDKYDRPFVKGVNKIIWAYGSDSNTNMKHTSRGYGDIELP